MLNFSKNILDQKNKLIIDYLENKLTKTQINYFVEFLMVGEEGLAYETLCEQIDEKDINISRDFFETLKQQCILYGIENEYFEGLKHLIVD